MLKKNLILTALATALFAMATRPAEALQFTLDTGNPGISGYPSPYGTIDVTLVDANTAQIKFTGANPAGYMYLAGDGGSIGLNTNGAATFNALSVSGVTQPQVSPSFPILTSGGAGNEDGFGSFNFTLNNFDGFGYAFSTLTFTIDKTLGTWSSEADVLTPNANGYSVAAHIFVANSDGSNTNSTGFATNGTSVPDGGTTMSLLGLALAGMGLVARRKN